jgi:hypothetical protein
VIATAGLTLALNSVGVGTLELEAAEPGKTSGIKSLFSKPIQILRGRSAEERLEKYRDDQRQAEAVALQNQPTAERPVGVEVPELNLKAAAELPQPGMEAAVPAPVGSKFQLLSDQSDSNGLQNVQQAPLRSTADLIESSYQNTASDPSQLKKVTSIQPFVDYEPETTQIDQQIDSDLIAPSEVNLGNETPGRRQMEPILYQWHASNLYHYPLYFEDPQLERYGHTFENYMQPFASVGRFGVQLAGLPYQMTIDPIWKRRYTLGWYRPGDVAPKQVHQIPWNTKAAINQAAVTTGLGFVFP